MATPWARLLNIYATCSLLFPPTLQAVFAKHPKTRDDKAENGSIFGREKNKTPNFEMQFNYEVHTFPPPASRAGRSRVFGVLLVV